MLKLSCLVVPRPPFSITLDSAPCQDSKKKPRGRGRGKGRGRGAAKAKAKSKQRARGRGHGRSSVQTKLKGLE